MFSTGFKTENDTLRKLLGNGYFYSVPRFQRDYSWELEQWEDLWSDIMTTLNDSDEPSHYMGYLVLQSGDDKAFKIIDGQQRITSLSLLILAVLKHLQELQKQGIDAQNNAQRIAQLRQSYIGYLDPVTLISHSKLTLNRNNNDYYQNYLVPLTHLPQRGFRVSEHLLRRSFEYFFEKVSAYIEGTEANEKGVKLASLVEQICDRLFFTVITVNDELNAYRVFETLNSRGVRLSSTDLLKNYLFSALDQGSESAYLLDSLEERWEQMVGRLQQEKFPEFLRAHWNSRHKFSRQADLFKNIRKQISSAKEVFTLLRDLDEDLGNYLALVSPHSSSWSMQASKELSELKLFGVRQPYPLLLAARRKLSDEYFCKLLRVIKVISFRYHIIGMYSPSELEKIYNQVAQRVSEGKIATFFDIVKSLAPIYIDDKRFKYDFSVKIINTDNSRNLKIVRYILCALEHYVSGGDYDFVSESFNVEHVLPQRAYDGWGGLSYEEMTALTYRLGNMALLNRGKNRNLGNDDYQVKRKIFAVSEFLCTRKIAEDYSEWNAESIASRQSFMASQAQSIWKVAQLDA